MEYEGYLLVGGVVLGVLVIVFIPFMFDLVPRNSDVVVNQSNQTRVTLWYKFPDFIFDCIPPYGVVQSDIEILSYFHGEGIELLNYSIERVTSCVGPQCARGVHIDLFVYEDDVSKLDRIVNAQSEDCLIPR